MDVIVYKAEDLKLGRRVALKFLPEELTNDRAAMERFEREARAASALNHPNICTIYAVEEYEDRPFIAMELLEGQTLRDLISMPDLSESQTQSHGLPLSLEALLDIALQIAAGMGAAHKRGIIDRDIKPANIFITSFGQAKILDFGLAKLEELESPESGPSTPDGSQSKQSLNLTLTRTGVAMGTAGYMSPEQVRGERLDSRTDLFSFGLVVTKWPRVNGHFPEKRHPSFIVPSSTKCQCRFWSGIQNSQPGCRKSSVRRWKKIANCVPEYGSTIS